MTMLWNFQKKIEQAEHVGNLPSMISALFFAIVSMKKIKIFDFLNQRLE